MAWVKAFHLILMVAWFAGLLYLPRLFVYHAMAEDAPSQKRFVIMERKLFMIMTIGAIGTVLAGVWLLIGYAWTAYRGSGWLMTKLGLALLLIAFHCYCYCLMRRFARGENRRTHVFYRWFNEVPAVMLVIMVILAVVKPF